jgi:hypothetical protein
MAAKKMGRHRRGDVLVDVRLRRPLWSTLTEMTKARPGGKAYHRRLRASLEKFAKSPSAGALGAKAIVADLRKLDYRTVRAHFDSAADWNQFRKMIGVSLTQLLEDALHPFRREIMAKLPKETEHHRSVDITVDQFWQLVNALPEHARPGIVTLAVTGMRLEHRVSAVHRGRQAAGAARRLLPRLEDGRRCRHHPRRRGVYMNGSMPAFPRR